MEKALRILAINPGSTSTKIALFDDMEPLFISSIEHSIDELKEFAEVQDQLSYRTETVKRAMADNGYSLESVDVFAGRGGGVVPVSGGTYIVCDLMADHAARAMSGGPHPAQLAPQIAKLFADKFGKKAFVVNPPDVDEFCDLARVSGIKGLFRESHIHSLNQKEIALRFCASRGLEYDNVNLVICHLGGGISITAHSKGAMVDSNDIINGTGPMTPTRAGDLPYMKVLDLAYSGEYTKKELSDKLNKNGGLISHFGTASVPEIIEKIENGDKYAKLIIGGMIYQIAKYAGAMAVALLGKVDAIILTGAIADNAYFTGALTEYLGWITDVVVMPHEVELEALAAGALRVMRGEETPKKYTGIPVWDGFDI